MLGFSLAEVLWVGVVAVAVLKPAQWRTLAVQGGRWARWITQQVAHGQAQWQNQWHMWTAQWQNPPPEQASPADPPPDVSRPSTHDP